MSNPYPLTVEQYREQLLRQLQACGIPRTSWESLSEYIVTGRPVGHFLIGVLSNDLQVAVTRADDLNLPRLPDYIQFLQSCAPSTCWGNPAAVREWMRKGGVVGTAQATQGDTMEVLGPGP